MFLHSLPETPHQTLVNKKAVLLIVPAYSETSIHVHEIELVLRMRMRNSQKGTMHKKKIVCLIAYLMLGMGGSVFADTISVNFHVANDADAQAEHELTGEESAGVAPYASTNWNNISVGNNGVSTGIIFPPTGLTDDQGNPTAATIAPSVSSSRFVGYAANSASVGEELMLAGIHDDDLYNSYLALGSADTAVLEVTGISSNYTQSGYRLIIYSDTDKRPDSGANSVRQSLFTITPEGGSGITALTEDDTAAPGVNTFEGTYVLSDNVESGADYSNYTVIDGMTATNFSLAISSPDGGRGGISGFQIFTGDEAVISKFDADATLVSGGSDVTLSWVVYFANAIVLDSGIGDVTSISPGGVGQITVNPTETTTYTLNASNATAGVVQESVTVTVGVLPPVINSFTADTIAVNTNGTLVTFSWDVADAAALAITPSIGAVNSAGQTSIVVNAEATFTLSASNETASVSSNAVLRLAASQPNILLVLVDDFGVTDTSVPFVYTSHSDAGTPVITGFNNFYHTPNMEALAARGMKFSQAHALPVCSPTRTSLMTGFNSPRHGITVHLNLAGTIDNSAINVPTHRGPNNWRYEGMDATDVTLPQLLGAEGYRTIHCGKAHFGGQNDYAKFPTAIGFDINIGGSNTGQPGSYLGQNNYGVSTSRPIPGLEAYHGTDTFLTDALTRELNKAIEQSVTDGVPFFGYMSYYAVHSPFTTNPDATKNYTNAVSANHERFATMVEGVDISIGDILAKLDAVGVAENTLIVFLGDNGSDSPALSAQGQISNGNFTDFPMRGKKASTYDGGTRVPLIISWAQPDGNNAFQQALPIAEGSVEHDVVGAEDIAPTILAVTGVAAPGMDGHDLSPYLRSESGSHRPQKLLRYVPHEHRSDYFLWFRAGDWKIIYRFPTDDFELYNIAADPDESNDLSTAQPGRVLTLARAMAQELDSAWGTYGELWPTFNLPAQPAVPARPLTNDVFRIPFDVDGRNTIDTDGDGLTDAEEDPDGNGLLDAAETSPDDADTDGDGSDDRTEMRLNLDPRNPDETFQARIISTNAPLVTLAWPSAPGASFTISSTTNLLATPVIWSTETNISASAISETTYETEVDGKRLFLKVGLEE
jgi:arylsulfatase A-like enzyme